MQGLKDTPGRGLPNSTRDTATEEGTRVTPEQDRPIGIAVDPGPDPDERCRGRIRPKASSLSWPCPPQRPEELLKCRLIRLHHLR